MCIYYSIRCRKFLRYNHLSFLGQIISNVRSNSYGFGFIIAFIIGTNHDGTIMRKDTSMKKLLISCISIAFLSLAGGQANALVISYSSLFSASNNVNHDPTVSNIDVTPFDPSLGTLNSVSVSISGQTHVDYTACPAFAGMSPIGYVYNIFVDQQFMGAGNKYFIFESPAMFSWMSAWYDPLGYAAYETFDNAFTYNFTFNDITDQAGRADLTTTNTTGFVCSSPLTVSGYMADFIDTGAPINQILFMQNTNIVTTVFDVPFSLSTMGSLTISYDYTPYPDPAPAPVPEPATMLLLGSGLLGLAGFRKSLRK